MRSSEKRKRERGGGGGWVNEFSRLTVPLPYGKTEAKVTRVKERSEAKRRMMRNRWDEGNERKQEGMDRRQG